MADLTIADLEDVRLELSGIGHNLTSVLINPRDTMYDEIMEDFWDDMTSESSSHSPSPSSTSGSMHGTSTSTGNIISMGISGSSGGASNESLNSLTSLSGHGNSSQSSIHNSSGSGDVDISMGYLKKNFRQFAELHLSDNSTTTNTGSSTGTRLKSDVLGIGNDDKHGERSQAASMLVSGGGQRNKNITNSSSSGSNYIHTGQEQVNKCYREVPDIFFSSDFSLSQPRQFEEVLAPANVSGNSQQKRLNEYLDLVEYALLQQIWSRSSDIFSALEDIKGQQDHVHTAIDTVSNLRSKLRKIDEGVASSAIHIPLMHRRRGNEDQLLSKLLCMQHVLEGRNNVHSLLEGGDFLGALELLAKCKNVYSKELSRVVSMRKVGEQLDAYDGFICEVISNRFVSCAVEWYDDENGNGSDNEDGVESGPGSGSELQSLSRHKYETNSTDVHNELPLQEDDLNSSSTGLSMEQLMQALLLIGHMPAAFDMYKSRLIEGLKLIVKTCVTEYMNSIESSSSNGSGNSSSKDFMGGDEDKSDSHTGNGSSSSSGAAEQPFAKRMRAMPVESFLSAILICFEHLLQALHRAHRVHLFMIKSMKRQQSNNDTALVGAGEAVEKIHQLDKDTDTDRNKIDDITQETISSSSANENTNALQELSKTCLASACDIAQRALNQLLLMRKADLARIPMNKMKTLWETASHFANQIEKINGVGTAYIIRQALQTQTTAFLSTVHERAKLRLASALDAERWVQCDVPVDKQMEIDRLASGKAFLKRAVSAVVLNKSSDSTSNGTTSSSNTVADVANGSSIDNVNDLLNKTNKHGKKSGGKRSDKHDKDRDIAPIIVDGKHFKVVWPALLVIEIIMSYLEIAIGFPLITGEVITSTKEILQLFNRTTLSLVLGSGAQKSQAQLRSISAKHLTITAQSLNLLIIMLPHIRAALLTQLPPNRGVQLTEIDRMSHDLTEHHSQILTKFVIILGDSIDGSVGKLSGVDWDNTNNSNSTRMEYFIDVSKNLTALHRVLLLESAMPLEQVQDIFSRIFSLIIRKLPTHFEDVNPITKTGKQCIMDEVTHLTAAVSLLQGINSFVEMGLLEEAFRRKYGRT